MRFFWGLSFVLVLALAGAACGDSSSGGGGGEGAEIRSDAALGGLMQAVVFDFAKVLAEVAPGSAAAAEKAGDELCPDGGTATWTESPILGAGGNLALDACGMRGVTLTGSLAGYLEKDPGSINAQMLRSLEPLTVAGGSSATLTVLNLNISANLPEPTDALTYWDIQVQTEDGTELCAWSGGSCPPPI